MSKMNFIMMNLIIKLHPRDANINSLSLNNSQIISLVTQETDEVIHVYLANVYATFGWSHNILSDSGSDLKKARYLLK